MSYRLQVVLLKKRIPGEDDHVGFITHVKMLNLVIPPTEDFRYGRGSSEGGIRFSIGLAHARDESHHICEQGASNPQGTERKITSTNHGLKT